MKTLRKLLITFMLGSIICGLFINNCSDFYVIDNYLASQKTVLDAFDCIEQGNVVLIDSSLRNIYRY